MDRKQLDRLRERVLASLAAGLAMGCADRAVTDDGGESSDDEESSSTGNASTSTTSSPTATTTPPMTASDDGSDGTRFDLPRIDLVIEPEPEPIPPETCAHPGGDAFPCESDEPIYYRCIEAPAEGCAAAEPSDAVQQGNDCLGSGGCDGFGFWDVACGPDPTVADACCYWLTYGSFTCPGRPFTVDGRERLADARSSDAWLHAMHPAVDVLSARERAVLADAWTECALFEHASVASFARFVLQLLAVGAPARLVARAQQAMAEELAHARAFFGLASAYAGRNIGPGTLPVEGSLAHADDLAHVAAAAASEGCIAETISALQIAIAADRARDPAVADVLHHIAEEELRHAELAWAFVGWALQRGDASVRRAVQAVFADVTRSIPRGPRLPSDISESVLAAHGQLPPRTHLGLARDALTALVLPAARELLTAHAQLAAPTMRC
jgi:hypothetical protein